MAKDLMSNIKTLRELKGFTQEYLAAEIGLSRASYNQVETRRTKLTAHHLIKIGEVLDIRVQDIIDFEKPVFYQNELEAKKAKEQQGSYVDQEQAGFLKEMIEMQRELIAKLKAEILTLQGS